MVVDHTYINFTKNSPAMNGLGFELDQLLVRSNAVWSALDKRDTGQLTEVGALRWSRHLTWSDVNIVRDAKILSLFVAKALDMLHRA